MMKQDNCPKCNQYVCGVGSRTLRIHACMLAIISQSTSHLPSYVEYYFREMIVSADAKDVNPPLDQFLACMMILCC